MFDDRTTRSTTLSGFVALDKLKKSKMKADDTCNDRITLVDFTLLNKMLLHSNSKVTRVLKVE